MKIKFETFVKLEDIQAFVETLWRDQLTVAIAGPIKKMGDCTYQTPDIFRVWFWDGEFGERIPYR